MPGAQQRLVLELCFHGAISIGLSVSHRFSVVPAKALICTLNHKAFPAGNDCQAQRSFAGMRSTERRKRLLPASVAVRDAFCGGSLNRFVATGTGASLELVSLTLIAVTLSIVIHGISVKPLMSRFLLHHGSSGS